MPNLLTTRHLLAVKRYSGSGTDAHGGPTVTYAAAVDWPVYGYSSGANASPYEANRDLSQVKWTVYAPVDANLPDVMDLVTVQGTDYALDGEPRDYSHDPFGHEAGQAVIYLKKVNG